MLKLDKLALSFVALIVVLLLLIAYMVTAVLKLPLTGSPDRITVHLKTTGGLFEGSPVDYRGSRVGTITSILVGENGPDATVTFKNGAEVPADSVAKVISLSPVGEQFLDLRPKKAGAPYFKDGDEISAEAVDLPITVASAADNLDDLLDEINDDDIKVLMRELNAAIDGAGPDLDQLLDSTDELVASLDEAWPRTDALLTNGLTVNQILARHQGDLVTFSKSAKDLTTWLKAFDPTFSKILKNAPADFDTVGLLIKDLGPILPTLLRNLNSATDLLADRDASVRALGMTTPLAVNKVNSSIRGGVWYLRAFVDGEALCDYGGPKPKPTVSGRNSLFRSGQCGSSPARWRGANHSLPPIDR
jgi:phospholipid/cholesterol/gamma-HCH transport system substrate-binding protein